MPIPRVPAGPLSTRFWLTVAGLLAAVPAGGSALAQDLVGCQLVGASLQCLPGLTASPQRQIRMFEGQAERDRRLEGAVEQSIAGLRTLVLDGKALEGALLTARLEGEALAALPPSAYHWYRLAPGRNHWELIVGASGATYRVSRNDIAYELMVVVAVPSPSGSSRSHSQTVGPVRALPATP